MICISKLLDKENYDEEMQKDNKLQNNKFFKNLEVFIYYYKMGVPSTLNGLSSQLQKTRTCIKGTQKHLETEINRHRVQLKALEEMAEAETQLPAKTGTFMCNEKEILTIPNLSRKSHILITSRRYCEFLNFKIQYHAIKT